MVLHQSRMNVLAGYDLTPDERRATVQQHEFERAAALQERLNAQMSPSNDARTRIGIWEKLHDLRLPQTGKNGLVELIAAQTNLTLRQVHEEQQRRAASALPPQAPEPSA